MFNALLCVRCCRRRPAINYEATYMVQHELCALSSFGQVALTRLEERFITQYIRLHFLQTRLKSWPSSANLET
eukprot:scaffold346888_cov49-Attheya_sp.AAC.3